MLSVISYQFHAKVFARKNCISRKSCAQLLREMWKSVNFKKGEHLVQESESFNTIGKPGQPQGIAPTICP
ncbi:MAG: hypothetical protein DRR16_13400 [Candidatus Parabeggiatoa sp. nov. 3]|nr:MAG: hypothetical protein DRR00_19300 [Gammaproteobacteria bacterium]RKZ60399.1 MAG: hypothetical protein DRQ99_22095 [Gammaproteobacteria bacterium]RKZ84884.1 MAG: hypothetical protein DRR16_13400 [Gammaproteobacteria bacterium]